MKKKFIASVSGFLAALLFTYTLFPPVFASAALGAVNALMAFGMPPELARYVTGNLVNVDASGNLILPVATGKYAVVNAGDLNFLSSGQTLGIQEATSASACSGTLTANATTPVVTSTTCAKTGSRIFLNRTSNVNVVPAYVSAISDGVSFSVTGQTADTGTYNWVIFHEAP